MEPWMIVTLILGAVVAVSVVVLVVAGKRETQRTAELEQLAREMSLDFAPSEDATLTVRVSEMSVMQRGHSRKVANVISGQANGVDLSLFDYHYVTGSGKNRTHHSLSVAVFESHRLNLPHFTLSPENFLHRVAGAFGYQDIDFAGYPLFNKKYLLRGPSEVAIRELFTEDVIQHFEAQLEHRKRISEVEGLGNRLMVSTQREKPANLRAFLAHAFATFGALASDEPAETAPPD